MLHSACIVAKRATNHQELTNFPERDDVQWMKHILLRLDVKHVENAKVVFEYQEVIDQPLDDQMSSNLILMKAVHAMADFKPSVFILDCPGTELIEQRADHDVIRTCKRVPGVGNANQTLLRERDSLMQSVTVPMLLCEPNTKTRPSAVRGRRTPGEDDEKEDPLMQGLRDDVAHRLDDGWSRGSRTVPVDTALVCSTPERARA